MEPKILYRSATELSAGQRLKQLALLSVGVMVAANLFLLLVGELISSLMQDATGLAMLGKRTTLLTIQSLLEFAVSVALPFWGYGFYKAAMFVSRKAEPNKKTLLWGFQKFWPLLRLLALELAIGIGYALLATVGATMLYMMTPWAARVMAQIEPALIQATTLTNDPEALNALMEPVVAEMMKGMWPMYLLIVMALGALLIPWLYKLRLAPYHILDGENSALKAMAISQQEMYGNKFSFFKLDLCWWWYYGLLALAVSPLYVYAYTGGSNGLFWVLTLVSYGLQLVIQWQFLPRVQTSYALAYDQLKSKTDNPPQA